MSTHPLSTMSFELQRNLRMNDKELSNKFQQNQANRKAALAQSRQRLHFDVFKHNSLV